jgi:hypothetical protein
MVRVPFAPADDWDDRRAQIVAVDVHDRAFLLGYLASTAPATFDLAIAALAAELVRREETQGLV